MSLFEVVREWTLAQGQTWYEIALSALSNLGLPASSLISGRVTKIYTDPPDSSIDAWALVQTRIARRPPNTALVNIIRPKEVHQSGMLIIYRIDTSTKSLVEAHYTFLCQEE